MSAADTVIVEDREAVRGVGAVFRPGRPNPGRPRSGGAAAGAAPAPLPTAAAGSVDGETLRGVMRRVPSPVAVVTTAGVGDARGMTINSLTSVSLDPPLVSFAVARSAQMHPVIEAAEGFAVHIVGVHQIRLCERFAEPGRSGREQFAGVLYGFDRDGNPILGGVLAVLHCHVHARIPAGDHTLVLGRVVEVRHHEGGAPLLFYDRSYRSVSGKV